MLRLKAFLVAGHMRHEASRVLHALHDQRTRIEAVHPDEFVGHQPVRRLHHARFGIEHVQHVARLDPGAAAHFEVVEIVARRDLHRA